MEGTGDLQCVGKLEIALEPKPVGFLCGTLPVPTDSAFPLSHSALLPSPSHTIGAPRYQMLPVQTDLNTLPILSNLPEKLIPSVAKNTEGYYCENEVLSPNLSRKCESLAVSGLTDYGDEIDVVAPTDILKQIFKIPYSKAKISIAVHRIGDTLILNTGPDLEEGEKMYRRPTNQSSQPKAKSKPKPNPKPNSKSKKPNDDSIFLNFAMHSVRVEACDCPPGHQPFETQNQNENDNESENSNAHEPSPSSFLPGLGFSHRDVVYSQAGEKQRGHVKEAEKNQKVGNDFMRVLVWQFHNFRMLLGSDLLIFSNEKYVAVSLHLWDVSRQVTPLTWLDAWLDNLMASVPELAICYHRNGVVQGYEMIKTDNIFLLKGLSDDGSPPFLPQVVQQHGLSVLRFLQDNCKQDPGAYWLYKGAGEDVIQLFDLSDMPKNRAAEDLQTGVSGSFPSLLNKGRRESLFSLGTLLYRVAHRLSLSKARDNNAKCAKFFKKCLDFLGEQDHLVVRAYAHEEFARLILRCYEELELNSESFLLESELNITDLEEEGNYEFTLDMLSSKTKDSKSLLTDSACSSGNPNPGNEIPTETLELCQLSEPESNSDIVRGAINDPISSKLAAIHHISQAIKSLRWKRQLQNARTDFDAFNPENYESSFNDNSNDLIVCSCGDPDCIEVCDIREWLPKSKMDLKLWKLVLLLGESYLALGEAYKENNQLHRALKVVELASLVYGSMPETLENSEFISSISSEIDVEIENPKLFWTKAWMLVGDVYSEYFRLRGNEIRVKREGIYVSNEVVKEVKRLKKKLGKDRQNCDTCQLLNCSCQSDRASSGNSASSSTSIGTGFNKRKKINKKTQFQDTFNNNASDNNTSSEVSNLDEEREASNEEREKPSTKGKNGGIFRFLEGPKFGEAEFNLNSAINCYEQARKATAGFFSEELKTLKKKKGWAYNELGRFKLEKGDLTGAEREFMRAVKTFQVASDHINVILINWNLGHGRRALAEDLVVKMDQIAKFEALKDVYSHSLKSAKNEYFLSLEYYTSAKRELGYLNEEPQKKQLINEVLTQYAHTYLRLGMLLAKEININNNINNNNENININNKEILASDAFRESLSTYESLNGARRQEAAFCCYNLGCYYKNMCFKFIEMDKNNNNNKMRQKIKWYGNLAEKYWYKAVQFYGPKTHANMYLNIIMDLSALSYHISSSFHSSSNLEAALMHLLEGRHIVPSDAASSSDLELNPKFWNQLQSLLKTMLSVSISSGSSSSRTGSGSGPLSPVSNKGSSSGRNGSGFGSVSTVSNKGLDWGKLKEMYRMSLKSTGFGQLHDMYDFWVS